MTAAAQRTMHVLTSVEGSEARYVAAAGTFASLVRHLRPGWRLRLSAFHDRARGGDRGKFAASFDPRQVELEWLDPDWTRFRSTGAPVEKIPVSHHRLFPGDYLPQADKAVWIDPDILFQRDAVELWETPLPAEFYCLAVQDAAAPLFDGATDPRLARRKRPEFNAAVPDCRSLGFRGTEPFFNGGVQVLNLAAWRRDRVADDLLRLYTEQWAKMQWSDQYFLNQRFVGRWGKLDPRWNRLVHALHPEVCDVHLMGEEEYQSFLRDPWTTHYGLDNGPWVVAGCPCEAEFFEAIDRTAWAGWRPPARPFQFGRWVQDRAHSLKRRLKKGIDKLVGRKA